MFLNIGQNVLVAEEDVVGIFELDNTTWAVRTREFLGRAEKAGRVTALGEDLPRSFVLCQSGGTERVYLSTLTTAALGARAKGSCP